MSDQLHGGIKMVEVLEQEMRDLQMEFLLKDAPEFNESNFFLLWDENKELRKSLMLAQREYYLEQHSKRRERRSCNDLLESIQILNRQHASEKWDLEREIASLSNARDRIDKKLEAAMQEIEMLKAGSKEEGTDA